MYAKDFLVNLIKHFPAIPDGGKVPFMKEMRLINKFISNLDNDPSKVIQNFCSLDVRHYAKNVPESLFINETATVKDILSFDRKNYLVEDILYITDKMSMQTGVEVRVPYLDQALINYIDTLPVSFLMKKGRKWILKELLNRIGGKEFASRRKEGFGLPVKSLLLTPKGKEILSLLHDQKSLIFKYVSYDGVKQCIDDFINNRRDYSSEVWSLLVLGHWLERRFGK